MRNFINQAGHTYTIWEVIAAAEGSGISWEDYVLENELEEVTSRTVFGKTGGGTLLLDFNDDQKRRADNAFQEIGPGGNKPLLLRFSQHKDLDQAREGFAEAVKTNTFDGAFFQEGTAVEYLYSIYNPNKSANGVQFREAEAGSDTVEIELTNGKKGQFNLSWKEQGNMRAFDDIAQFMESRKTVDINPEIKEDIRNTIGKLGNDLTGLFGSGEKSAVKELERILPQKGAEAYEITEHSGGRNAITIKNPNGVKRHIYFGAGLFDDAGTRYYSQNDEAKYYARNMDDVASEIIRFLEENEDFTEAQKEAKTEFAKHVESKITDEMVMEAFSQVDLSDLRQTEGSDEDLVFRVRQEIEGKLGMSTINDLFSSRTEYSSLESHQLSDIIETTVLTKLNNLKHIAVSDAADQFRTMVNNGETEYDDVVDFFGKYLNTDIRSFNDGSSVGKDEMMIAGYNAELHSHFNSLADGLGGTLDEKEIERFKQQIAQHAENINLTAGEGYEMSMDLSTGQFVRVAKDKSILDGHINVEADIIREQNEMIDYSLSDTPLAQLTTLYETNALAFTQIEKILNTKVTYDAILVEDAGYELDRVTVNGTYRDLIYQESQGYFTNTTARYASYQKKAGLGGQNVWETKDSQGETVELDPDRVHLAISAEGMNTLQQMAPELTGEDVEGRDEDIGAPMSDRHLGRQLLTSEQLYFDDIVHSKFKQTHRELKIQKEAVKRMYLLNEDVSTWEHKTAQNMGHMSLASVFGEEQTQEWLGYSDRAVLDEALNTYSTLGWELDLEQKKAVERSGLATVGEGVAGSVGILIEFAIANKATAALRGAKLFSKAVSTATKTGTPVKTLQWRSFDDILKARTAKRYSNGKQIVTSSAVDIEAARLGLTRKEFLAGMRWELKAFGKKKLVKRADKFGGWKALPANALNQGQRVLTESFIEGLKFSAIGGDFTHGFGFGFAGHALAPMLGNVVNISKKVQAGKNVNAPFWLVDNAVRLEKGYQLAFKGPMSFAVGTELGEIVHATYQSLAGEKRFGEFLDDHFRDNTDFTKQFMANIVIGGFFGLGHKANTKGWASKSKLQTEKSKIDHQMFERDLQTGEYIGPRKTKIKWNKKTKKWDDVYEMVTPDSGGKKVIKQEWNKETKKWENVKKKMTESDALALLDIYNSYDAQIKRHLYNENLNDPMMGATIISREYKKQVEFYKQEGKILEYEAVNNKSNPEMAGQRAKFEPVLDGKGKETDKIKVTFNVDNYAKGVTPHELGHAGMHVLFGRDVRFKSDFMKQLLEISKKIKVEQLNPETNKRMTLHEQMTGLKKKWADSWEAGRITDWEMFSYISEALSKPGNLSHLQGSGAFRLLGDFVQNSIGKKTNQNYDFTLQKDVARFFGDYIQSINKGTNSLKVLKHLENVVDYETTKQYKKGEKLDPEIESLKRNAEEMMGTTVGETPGLKSENLMKSKKQIFDENVNLLKNKPEKTGEYFPAGHEKEGQQMTWRELQKANAVKIREINKKIETDNTNVELIDKYKEYKSEVEGKEITQTQKLKESLLFKEIQKNNKEVLDLYVNTMHKNVEGGASRKNFENYVKNTELLKIVNSYSPEGGASFRTYLYGTLFGGGKYGGGRMGNILKALKVDMDVVSKKSSLDRMMEESNFDVIEKTAVAGEGGPLTKLNGSKGAELIYELNAPEVTRYIERFNEIVEKGEGPFKDIETVLNLDYNTLGSHSKKGTEFHDIILDIMGGKGISSGAVQARGNKIADNWRLLYEVEPVYSTMKTSGKAMGVENSLMTDISTGKNVHYKKTGETVKAAKTGAKTGTEIQKKIPLSEFKNMAEAKKWYLETLGIKDSRTAQEIADGTGNVEILTKDRNIILTRQYSVLSTFSNGMFNQLTRKALAEGKLPDLENRIAAETLANQIKAGGLTGKVPKTSETGKLEQVELYSELLSGFAKKFAGELGVKFGENKGGTYLANTEGLERMQDVLFDYAFGNRKNIPSNMLKYIDTFHKFEGVFETKEAAANWARIEIDGYKGRVKKASFDAGFKDLKMEDVKLGDGTIIKGSDIIKEMDLSAGSYMYQGNRFVQEAIVRDRVKRSIEFAQYLPKDIIDRLVKDGKMTNSEASGFVKHLLGLHTRLSFEGVQSEVSIKKSKISETGEIIEGKTVATLSESGESILGKDYTQSWSKALKNFGKLPSIELNSMKWSFVPEAKLRSGGEKMANAKTEVERIKLAEEYFSKLDNQTKKDLYYAIESAKQDYIYSSKNRAEFMSRANWMYSLAKGNSNLVQGVRQTVPVHAVWFGKGKLTGDRIKLEHMKASVAQSIQTANLVMSGKFKEAGKEAAADFIGLTAPEKMLKFIDNQGGLVNNAGLVRMAFLHPKLLKQFRTVESNFEKTLYEEITEKYGVDLFGKKKFVELLKDHKLVTKQQKTNFKNKTGLNSENMSDGKSLPEMARIIDNAIKNGRLKNKNKRGMSTFDFDETVGFSENYVFATKDGKTKKIASDQWPFVGEKLKNEGWKMDFTDFNKVTGGKPGPLMEKMKNQIKKFGPDNVFILTARAKESQGAIHEYLKSEGINIPKENITGLGNSTGEAKALWMLEKFSEGYNDMYFVDDAMPNVKAVKDVLSQLDIKSNVQSVRNSLNSDMMSKTFNQILFEKTGVEDFKTFSSAKAKILGGKRMKHFKVFGTPGAEDFMGLVTYSFSGKGKKGEAHQEFFRETLERPFSRAYNEIHSMKQSISNDYKALRQQFPEVRKRLNEKVDEVFSVDQAIRVYNWNKAGFEIPGLSKTDLKTLTDFVKSDGKIQHFAEQLSAITRLKEGYVKPRDYWLGENIQFDLNSAVDKVHRKEALTEFVQNRESIFGKWENGRIVGDNMNKIEATYGSRHREALENMLWRMENGTNRTTGADSNTNKWMNWVNSATGTIMFFNQKSAALQTISSLNYVNGTFNNPFRAAQAFANQPQYWKDFARIFNSDMLLQRRSGLKINVEAAELLERVGGGEGGFARFRAYLLEKGFIPTKYADSFAIASGGATYYRNKIRRYKKDGLDKVEAERKAWEDFSLMTEQTQQSSRPDLISMQQASALGRPILAFANTPMQMFRRHKRRIQDIANNRGNMVENIGSALYYGFAQTAVFSFLANAMFAVDDESDEAFSEKKKSRYVNTILDSYLRGQGTGGASISALKNGILSFEKESEKDYNADYGNTVIDILNVSPPIGSKMRKIYSALKTYKRDKDVMGKMGLSLDNPATLATANVISAFTNIPADRVVMKLTNIKDATTGDFENWQRIAMLMGINKWSLGEYEDASDAVKSDVKSENKQKKQRSKLKEKYPEKSDKEIDKIIEFKKESKSIFKLNKKQQNQILLDNTKTRTHFLRASVNEETRVKAILKLIKDGKIDKNFNKIK